MDLFQWGTNPWGQEILIRISWDLLYLAFFVGVAFLVGHAIWKPLMAKAEAYAPSTAPESTVAAIPAKIEKHSLASRIFHWIMAASMLVLLFTGFLPIVGIQFAWVTIHWIAGVILALSIVYHIVHALFFQDPWAVWIGPSDVAEGMQRLKRQLGGEAPLPRKPDKYPLDNRMYHTAVMFTGLGVIITGILMMFRVETALWSRNPYLLSDQTWGYVYVLHGLTAVALVTLTMAHIYFAIRPEKLWMTRSMFKGWITRDEYLEHHDPARWVVAKPAAGDAARDA